ncbi:hypothetical protein C1H46_043112 [Malus baccata]|uniref:Uncharacterized protein n=1 Tax=Malus baccata TaxID=106549 RepID=A0A540KBN7_MALBA|nr:hypothetical protein C1H46_043112 [Malus baccata]
MATESSEGEEDAKLTRGNQLLIVDDNLREMSKKLRYGMFVQISYRSSDEECNFGFWDDIKKLEEVKTKF